MRVLGSLRELRVLVVVLAGSLTLGSSLGGPVLLVSVSVFFRFFTIPLDHRREHSSNHPNTPFCSDNNITVVAMTLILSAFVPQLI